MKKLLEILKRNKNSSNEIVSIKFEETKNAQKLDENFIVLPESIDNFDEWHYKALRKLDRQPVNQGFTGLLSLKINFDEFTSYAVDAGVLEIMTYNKTLQYMKNDVLKIILKHFGLKTSGGKKELVERILVSLNEAVVRDLKVFSDYYQLTPKGQEILDASYEKIKSEDKVCFKNAMDLILQGNYDEAYRMIYGGNIGERTIEYQKNFYMEEMGKTNNELILAAAIYEKMSGESRRKIKEYLVSEYNADDDTIATMERIQKLARYDISAEEFDSFKAEIPFKAGDNDVIWGILNQRTVKLGVSTNYIKRRNNYLSMACLLEEEENKEALQYYCMVICFDLNGLLQYDSLDRIGKPKLISWIADRLNYAYKTHNMDYVDYGCKVTAEVAYSQCWIPKPHYSEEAFIKIINNIVLEKKYTI